ncbi:hypothetical protein PT974_09991 [Cladobotryum mycophilum]|uniref:Myb/SANT-like domain-containing protein n=1 Tax=Cladobotryum mycophilum TaxID=491253 RepID=A0ABR0S8K6_9HYPO
MEDNYSQTVSSEVVTPIRSENEALPASPEAVLTTPSLRTENIPAETPPVSPLSSQTTGSRSATREARNEGYLQSAKSTFVKAVMERLLPSMTEQFPHSNLQTIKLITHFKSLRTKHRMFLWITERTGVTYDEDSGMVDASDEQWDAYRQAHGPGAMWLKIRGLPRPGLYAYVFEDNEAMGRFIVSAGDDEGFDAIDLATQLTENAESEVPSSSGTENQARRIQSVRRRVPQNNRASEDTPEIRRQTMQSLVSLASTIEGCMSSISSSISAKQKREPGAGDIDLAIQDCRRLFRLSGRQLVVFAKGITVPLMAVCWNNFRDDKMAKLAMLEEILGERVDESVVVDV